MKKNTVALAVAAAMTASLLVGCGGTAADSTSTAESIYGCCLCCNHHCRWR